jgi:fermentation-respiration switch protein FrsA (DUF1100 family)
LIFRTPKYTGPERRRTPRWRPRPLRVLLWLLILSAVGYGAAVLSLMEQEGRLVFQAGSTLATGRPLFPYEQVALPHPDGAQQFAWLMRREGPDGGPWAIYLHGTASSVASQVNIAHYRLLRNTGLNVLAPEYRGFGGLAGTPTETTVRADALAAYTYLRDTLHVPPGGIVVHGWSLGSAVAVDMATRLPPAALILEGAPASLVDLTGSRYPFVPLRLLMRSDFDSIRTIGQLAMPLLFLHGRHDEVIPLREGQRLYAAARAPKVFVELDGGHVDAIEKDGAEFENAVRTFLTRQGVVSQAAVRNP